MHVGKFTSCILEITARKSEMMCSVDTVARLKQNRRLSEMEFFPMKQKLVWCMLVLSNYVKQDQVCRLGGGMLLVTSVSVTKLTSPSTPTPWQVR